MFKYQNKNSAVIIEYDTSVFVIRILVFEFVSNFVIRYSNLTIRVQTECYLFFWNPTPMMKISLLSLRLLRGLNILRALNDVRISSEKELKSEP